MKKTIHTILLVIIQVLGLTLQAQEPLSNPVSIPPSPHSQAFMKYGEYSVNYSTGVPNISIPIHEIDHHGFKIPVSMNYNHQGLKPGYNVDVFGLGWGVNPTGKISRTIKRKADEMNDFVIETIDPAMPYHLVSDVYNDPRALNISPDIFHVMLPSGLSFDFTMVKENGQYNVWVSNEEPVIVNYDVDVLNEGTWKITDKNGIKYIFLRSDSEEVIFNGGKHISTWNLSRVELPNSNEDITYFYRKGILNRFLEPDYTTCISGGKPESYLCGDQYTPNNLNYQTYLLERVSYGNSYIGFTYNAEINGQYADHNFIKSISIGETGGNVIKKVTFNMSDHGVHNLSADVPLMRLDSIAISGYIENLPPKRYEFIYEDFSTFTSNTDHWGYLNGYTNTSENNLPGFYVYMHRSSSIPEYCYGGAVIVNDSIDNSIAVYKLGNANKDPGGRHGVLNKIIYPTGGYTEFIFERNQFKSIARSDCTYSGTAAGYRIAEITNYTSDQTLTQKKIFKYGELISDYMFGPKHTNCGIAPVEPNAGSYLKYRAIFFGYNSSHDWLYYDHITPPSAHLYFNTYSHEHCFSSSTFRSLLNGRPPVVYPEVTVYTGELRDHIAGNPLDKTIGKTVYKYDYFNTEGNFIEPWYFRKDGSSYYLPQNYRYNKLIEQIDYKREDVITESIYTTESVYTPVKKTENYWVYLERSLYSDYYLIRTAPSFYPVEGLTTELFYARYAVEIEACMPVVRKRTTTEYRNVTDSIKTVELMNYDLDGFLTFKQIENSNNETTTNSYKYPKSYGEAALPIVKLMRNDENHILSPLIESSTKAKNSSGSEKLVSGTKTDFKEFTVGGNTLILPERSNYLEINEDGTTNEITQSTIKSYTANGNPKEVLGMDGISTCYIWGYNDRYPVAKIVDASYDEASGNILSTVGNTSFTKAKIDAITAHSGTREALIALLNEIRTDLPSAMVTTYTYRPLVGMTSQTDINGTTVYYEYDAMHRLQKVLDKDLNILKTHKYHYAK